MFLLGWLRQQWSDLRPHRADATLRDGGSALVSASKRRARSWDRPAVSLRLSRLEPRIVLSGPPTAVAAPTPDLLYFVAEGSALTLDGTASYDDVDPSANLVYLWDLNNDGTFETSGSNPTFDATALDVAADRHLEQTINLRVIDTEGNESGVASARVVVYSIDPVNGFATSHAVVAGQATVVTGTADALYSSDSTYLINWGDGATSTYDSSDPGSDVVLLGDGAFYATHVYASSEFGAYQVGYQASNGSNSTNLPDQTTYVTDGQAHITDAVLTGVTSSLENLVEGDVIRLSVTATGANPNSEFQLQVNWGDGSSDTYTFGEAGTYDLDHALVNDSFGEDPDYFVASFNLTGNGEASLVDDAQYMVANASTTLQSFQPQMERYQEGDIVRFDGTYSDPGDFGNHVISVDWNDGTITRSDDGSGSIVIDPVAQTFTARHLYQNQGPQEGGQWFATATIYDDESDFYTGAGVIVENVAPTLTNILLDKAALNEGEFVTIGGQYVDPGALDTHTVVIYWSDGTSSSSVNGGVILDTVNKTFTAKHQYLDGRTNYSSGENSFYTIVTQIYDNDFSYNYAYNDIEVIDVLPQLTNLEFDGTAVEGSPVTLTGQIVDPGTEYYRITIDWADGTTSEYVSPGPGPVLSGPVLSGPVLNAPGVIEFDPFTKTFSATHVYVDDDPTGTTVDRYEPTVTVEQMLYDDYGGEVPGDYGGSDFEILSLDVLNAAPVVGPLSVSPDSTTEGNSVTVSGQFSDAGENDTFTVVIDWGDGTSSSSGDLSVNYDSTTGMFSAQHTYLNNNGASPGYTIIASVTDDDGGVGTSSINVNVANVAPVLTGVDGGPASLNEGGTVTLSGFFNDPGVLDGEIVIIVWGDGTTSRSDEQTVEVNPSEGGQYFFASHTYLNNNSAGSYTYQITVIDSDGGSDTQTGTFEVLNVAPTLTNVSADEAEINEGDTVTLSGEFNDPGLSDGQSVVVTWGDGTTSTSADGSITVTALGDGYYAFTAAHRYLDNNDVNPYSYTVTVTDSDGATSSVTGSEQVYNVAPLPSGSFDRSTIREGENVTYTGRFTDPGLLDTHTVYIDWGDGTWSESQSGDFVIDETTMTFQVTHRYLLSSEIYQGEGGNAFYIYVQITDKDGDTDYRYARIEVEDVAAQIVDLQVTNPIVEGNSILLTGRLVDPGLDYYRITVNWGDGQTSLYTFTPPDDFTPPGGSAGDTDGSNAASDGSNIVSFDPVTKTFSASHVYLDDNPTGTSSDRVPVTITVDQLRYDDRDYYGGVTDSSQDSSVAVLPVTVNNAPPEINNLTLNPASLFENGTVTLTGHYRDAGVQDSHQVTIFWGDGGSSRSADGTVLLDAETQTFTATHRFLDNNASGKYEVVARVSDDDGGVATFATTAFVFNVNPTIALAVDHGEIVEGNEVTVTGSYSDPGSVDTHSIVVTWGDGSVSRSDQGLVFIDPVSRTYSATHRYLDDSPASGYQIVATVIDDDGGAGRALANVTVLNAAPQISSLVLDDIVSEGGVATLRGEIHDNGIQDRFQLLVNWGDGRTELFTLPAGTTSFTEQHLYVDDDPSGTPADRYTVTVTLIDDDSAEQTATAQITVLNADPVLSDLTLDREAVAPGEPLVLTGRLSDVGVRDSHQLLIAWGDGTSSSTADGGVTLDLSSGIFSAVHRYAQSMQGEVLITVTAIDDDGGTARGERTLFVNASIPLPPPPPDQPQPTPVPPPVPTPLDPLAPRFAIPQLSLDLESRLLDRSLSFGTPGRNGSEFTPTPLLAILIDRPRPAPAISEPLEEASLFEDLTTSETTETQSLATVRGERVLLRVIGADGTATDELEIDNSVLTQLPDWYSRLLDDHYRLYIVREDGTELLHSEVVVRQGKPVDPNDAAESGSRLHRVLPADPATGGGVAPDPTGLPSTPEPSQPGASDAGPDRSAAGVRDATSRFESWYWGAPSPIGLSSGPSAGTIMTGMMRPEEIMPEDFIPAEMQSESATTAAATAWQATESALETWEPAGRYSLASRTE